MKSKIPKHLLRYVVEQDPSNYSLEEQAVWRFSLKALKKYLKDNAEKSYLKGLDVAGINQERIPEIDSIDKNLQTVGWRALPVSGFIPPAAFMEFQANKILPIARDMRSVNHLLYTPAPDIIHEAAGHAPLLVNKEFSNYLQLYAQIAAKALYSKEDMALYEAIRDLSDAKEDCHTTQQTIQNLEKKLEEAIASISYISEANKLSRMNWWTAEYGLIGDLNNPKIYGAGLLSSVGESRSCLVETVKKIPLTIDCVNYSYDITKPQPQLFVAENFDHLNRVLEELSETLAYKRGGIYGCEEAVRTKVVNTFVFDSQIQISGRLSHCQIDHQQSELEYLQFSGPTQIGYNSKLLSGHGSSNHKDGYGMAIGKIKNLNCNTFELTKDILNANSWIVGKTIQLEFKSGIIVKGKLNTILVLDGFVKILTFDNCTVKKDDKIYFSADWGLYDLVLAENVESVYSRCIDEEDLGIEDDFKVKQVIKHAMSPLQKRQETLYQLMEQMKQKDCHADELKELYSNNSILIDSNWLIYFEFLNLLKLNLSTHHEFYKKMILKFKKMQSNEESLSDYITIGLDLLEEVYVAS